MASGNFLFDIFNQQNRWRFKNKSFYIDLSDQDDIDFSDAIEIIKSSILESNYFKDWKNTDEYFTFYSEHKPVLQSPDILMAVCIPNTRSLRYLEDMWFSLIPIDECDFINILSEPIFYENSDNPTLKKISGYQKLIDKISKNYIVDGYYTDEDGVMNDNDYQNFIHRWIKNYYDIAHREMEKSLKEHCPYTVYYRASTWTSAKL